MVRRYAKTGVLGCKESAVSISRMHENTRFRAECAAEARRLASDTNPKIRAAAADVLAEMDQELPTALFDDPDARVRALAYIDLLNRRPEEVPGLMERALASNEEEVACQAIHSFKVGQGEAKRSLIAAEFSRLRKIAETAMNDGRENVVNLGEAMATQLVAWADASKGSYRVERLRRRIGKRVLGGYGVRGFGVRSKPRPGRCSDEEASPIEEDDLPF